MKIFVNPFQKREAAPAATQQEQNVGGGSFEEKTQNAGGVKTSPTVAAWYRGLELRANAMSQLRMEYQSLNAAGGNFVMMTYGDYGRINFLLQIRPNYYENAAQMWKRAELHRILKGNAYIYKETGVDGKVVAFHLCNTASYLKTEHKYIISYSPEAITKTVEGDCIIHLKNTFTTPDGTEGIPTLTFAARALNISATGDAQTLDTLSKGGRLKLLLNQAKERFAGVGAKLNEKQMQKRKEDIQRDLYSGDVGVIPFGTEVQTISMTSADMQVLENRKFQVSEVGRFLGIPASMLMDLTNSNYKTAEHATLELFRTVSPMIKEIEDEFNGKLLTDGDFGKRRFHLCEKPLFRLDLTSQAAWNKARLETGCATVNELRAEQDMPSIENGDKLLLSANLKTMEMLEKEGSNPQNTQGGEKGGEE